MTTNQSPDATAGQRYYRRFARRERILHAGLMVSFLGLATTGMPLFFHEAAWAGWVARALGGFEAAGTLHRTFAVVMIGCFSVHLGTILHRLFVQQDLGILWGPNSMVPQPSDVRDMFRHFQWFVGLGPRPKFDHFTYWEKFDYWAVFWGMGIIGGSGLVLWFPEFFARFVPGWVFSVALLIHGEEALLATGFIFTIHFFNSHVRTEKFPMDTVMFTGRVSEQEFRHERPTEYARLRQMGRLQTLETKAPAPNRVKLGRVLGTFAVGTGLIILVLILYGVLSY